MSWRRGSRLYSRVDWNPLSSVEVDVRNRARSREIMKVLAEARPRRIAMKRGRLAGLAIGLGVVFAAACGRAAERPVAERAERSTGPSSPYVTDIGEIQVDYRSVSIPDHMTPGGGVYF